MAKRDRRTPSRAATKKRPSQKARSFSKRRRINAVKTTLKKQSGRRQGSIVKSRIAPKKRRAIDEKVREVEEARNVFGNKKVSCHYL